MKAVVVCRAGADGALADRMRQVCQALDITVWSPKVDLSANYAKPPPAPTRVELVAYKECPTRGVIGQLITAKHLLDMAHSGLSLNLVIACSERGNVSLKPVCDQLGIEVRTSKKRFAAERGS